MNIKYLKIIILLILLACFVISWLENVREHSVLNRMIMFPAIFLYGFHLVYAYLFDLEMYARGITMENNKDHPVLRFFYFCFGFVLMGVSCYGFWYWHERT